MHPGDLAGGFSDLEMTWLLYCAGAATESIFAKVLVWVLAVLYNRSICIGIDSSFHEYC